MDDHRLVTAWQARQDAADDARFRAMFPVPSTEAPAAPAAPSDTRKEPEDPSLYENWVLRAITTTGADVSSAITRGVTLGFLRLEDVPVIGRIIEENKTPESRMTGLQKWAEVGLEIASGTPFMRFLSPLGTAATKLLPAGAGAVAKGATKVGAEMTAVGAGQQVVPLVKGEETLGEAAGKTVASGAMGAAFGAAVAKLEPIIAAKWGKKPEAPKAEAPKVDADDVRFEQRTADLESAAKERTAAAAESRANLSEIESLDVPRDVPWGMSREEFYRRAKLVKSDTEGMDTWKIGDKTFDVPSSEDAHKQFILHRIGVLKSPVHPEALKLYPDLTPVKRVGALVDDEAEYVRQSDAWVADLKAGKYEGKAQPAAQEKAPIPAGPSSLERKPIGALNPAPTAPEPPPAIPARTLWKQIGILRGAKEGMGQRARESLDDRIAELRVQAQARDAVEIAEQSATGMKDPAVLKGVQEAVQSGRLVLPGGMTVSDLGPSGKSNPAFVGLLARVALGALGGYVTGDTPEDRVRNALVGAGIGAALSPALLSRMTKGIAEHVVTAEREAERLTVKQGRRLVSIKPLTAEEAKALQEINPDGVKINNDQLLSINWKEYGGAADDLKALTKKFYGAFGDQGPGSRNMSDEAMNRLADRVGLPRILARGTGEALNREESAAAVRFFGASAMETLRLLDLAKGGAELTPDMLRQMGTTAALFQQLKGASSEAGASLRVFKLSAELMQSGQLQSLADLAKTLGGAQALTLDGPIPASAIKEMLSQVARSGESKVFGFLRNVNSGLIEAYINSLLSAAVTFARNAIGTGGMLPLEIGARALASRRPGSEVVVGEAEQMIFGVVEASRDILRLAAASLEANPKLLAARVGAGAAYGAASGDDWESRLQRAAIYGGIGAFATAKVPAFGMSKLEGSGNIKGLTADKFGLDPASFFSKGIDLLGDLIRTPGDALRTADNIFKLVNFRASLRALALREATAMPGATAEQIDAKLSDLLANPPEAMLEASRDLAARNTFTQKLGEFWGKIADGIDSNIVSKFFIPFMRTTLNIGGEVLKDAPITGQLYLLASAEMRRGGAARDIQIAKQALAAMVVLPAMYLASKGYIQGDLPRHQGTRRMLEVGGVQRYSVQVKGKSYAFDGMAPMGAFLGLAADVVQMMQHADDRTEHLVLDFAKAYTLAIAQNVTSQTFIQVVSNLTDAVLDEDGAKLERFLKMQTRSLVPRAMADWARQDDQVRQELHNIKDYIYSQIPTLSRDLPAQRDRFGRILYRPPSALGPDGLSPIYSRTLKNDPAVAALRENGITLPLVPRYLFGRKTPATWFSDTKPEEIGIELTPQQHDRYAELAGYAATDKQGRGFHQQVTAYVTSPEYQRDSRAGREARIYTMHNESMKKAGEMLLQEFRELARRGIEIERARAELRKPTAEQNAALLSTLGR
ncbi:MAG: hypothetical protein ABFD94_07880 [Armatimonadia bacterium]